MIHTHLFRFVVALLVATVVGCCGQLYAILSFGVGVMVLFKDRSVGAGICAATSAVLFAFSAMPSDVVTEPQRSTFEGTVMAGPVYYDSGCGYDLELTSIDDKTTQAKALTTSICDLRVADRVVGFGRLAPFQDQLFPGVPSQKETMHRRGYAIRLTVIDIERVIRPTDLSLRRQIADRRAETRDALIAAGADRFALAMIVGDKSALTDEDKESLRKVGLSHLLAISGLHFGAVAVWVWVVVGWAVSRSRTLLLRFSKQRLTTLVGLPTMFLFLMFVGAPISAVRAYIMLAAYGVALVAWRRVSPFVALGYAVAIALLIHPFWIRDIGFQFSVSAVLSILMVLARVKRSRFSESRFAKFVAVSFAASLGTWPVSLVHFGTVSLVGPFVNLVIVPLFSMLYFPALIVASVGAKLGLPTAVVFSALSDIATGAVSVAAAFPIQSAWVCGTIPAVVGVMLYGCAAVAMFAVRVREPVRIAAAIVSIGVVALTAPGGVDKTTIYFIPVGQGDATLVRFHDGTNLLVDAGGASFGRDPGAHRVVPLLHRLGIQSVDTLVVTHDDIDHRGGVDAVLRNVVIGRTVTDAKRIPERPNIRALQFSEGNSKNDRSVIIEIREGKQCVLLTGDVEAEAEAWLAGQSPCGTILKVPHHGSKTSSTSEFVAAVSPRVAIVSAARFSRFGHPHPDVVQTYRDADATIFHTEVHGLVVVEMTETESTVKVVNQPKEIP